MISGGTIVAISQSSGAGIGAGRSYAGDSSSGNITITGGDVTAKSGWYAAGIGIGSVEEPYGGPYNHQAGEIVITGGTVHAYGAYTGTGASASTGPGIGSCKSDVKGLPPMTVTIGGNAYVEAYGGNLSAGIGGSNDSSKKPVNKAGTVNINGGTVKAYAGNLGAGIGGGEYQDGADVTITGGVVEAYGDLNSYYGGYGAGIGGGNDGNGGTCTITGGHVLAVGGSYAAGIGGGGDWGTDGGTTIIEGGEVEAHGGKYAAGIGGADYGNGGSVTISGGTVVAEGGELGPGIGSGCKVGSDWSHVEDNTCTVSITGGDVTATGSASGAGIGFGDLTYGRASMNINISDGTVRATGGTNASGIGFGKKQEQAGVTCVVNVTGGTVTAMSGAGDGAQAIGVGSEPMGSTEVQLAIYPAAKVLHGTHEQGAALSLAANRVADCRDPWAQISPCQHEGVGYTPTQDKLHHVLDCPYCLGTRDAEGKLVEHDHEWVEGDGGAECACSVKAYRVSFDANGAGTDGSMATSDLIIEGCSYDIPECGFTRTGYSFAGWNTAADDSGQDYADGGRIASVESGVTLYAQWSAHVYKVSFDKNAEGVTGSMGEQAFTYDAEQALAECGFSRTGYDFSGWNTKADGSGQNYADKAGVRNLTDKDKVTVVLYAQWAAHKYKVAFDKNAADATGTMAEQGLTYGADPVALSKNAFKRTGHSFAGWNTVADGSGDAYPDGARVADLTDEDGATVTLFAQWRANAYRVAFDKNAADATGTMTEQGLTYGADPVALPKNAFKRAGHAFAGWNTKADGTGDAYPDGARVADLTAEDGATVTLFAQWRANAYTVTFDAAGGSAVAAQKVTYGKQAKKPASPTKGAWTFGGWYSDATLKSAYDFAKPVTGNLTLHAKWNRTSIAKAMMAKVADQAYTAKAITPKPAVKLGSKTLKLNTDYVLSYKANVRAGTATVTATGRGAYAGSVSRTFRIVAPAGSATATLLDGRRSTAALGKTCGTVGKSMTMTSLAISLARPFPVKGGIEYRTHVQTTGWEKGWKRDGAVAGNPKAKKRLEAVQIRLYGDMAKRYDVYYRAHVQRVGWMAWAKNGASAGTQSGSRRMEAVQVVLVPTGAKAPANTGASTKAVFVDWSKQK